jgi:hypothetical protein
MWLSAGQSGVEFAFLSRFGATGGATDTQCLVLTGFHDSIMRSCRARCWSIVTGSKSFKAEAIGHERCVRSELKSSVLDTSLDGS